MDSLIAASARALAAGDTLGALKHVALREDPPALALRGIAMAQLGEHARARELLRRAAREFGRHEAWARARCIVAEAEVALAMRDFGAPPQTLNTAMATLQAHGDKANAQQARLIAARRMVLLGRLAEAATLLSPGETDHRSPTLSAMAELIAAELALRALRIQDARAALTRAHEAALQSRVPALVAEVKEALTALDRPAARCMAAGKAKALCLDEVAELLDSDALVLDACRRGLRAGQWWQPLARRPVLFALAEQLAAAWPQGVPREALISHAFRTRHPDETHRARLRVEIGRLRKLIAPMARIDATPQGFVLQPHGARDVVVLTPPIDGDQASLLALLADGAAWSTSALALALGDSQRTVQRALAGLQSQGRVQTVGRARAQRWLAPPLAGFTTILLLPAALSPER